MKAISLFLLIVLFSSVNTINAQFNSRNDSIISEAISLIDIDSIEYQLQWLQDMGTRFMIAPNRKEVAENIKERFESYGITNVRLDSFECYTNIDYGILHYDTTTWQYNVEAKIIGSNYPDEEMLLMGHHDNVQLDSNPELYAPGADDNGSGTVAALEIARVLMQMEYQPERTIIFLTTAAEELMYFGDAGSEHYAAEAEASGRNIWGVINNDMIAYNDGSDIITFSNVIGSEEITGVAEMIANTYTSLYADIQAPQPNSGADLKPFIDAGYHGVYLMESVFNPYYHTEMDLVEYCDFDYLTEAIKISCGTILHSDITVGMSEPSDDDIKLAVYPNPCKSSIKVVLKGDHETSELSLYSTSGQFLFNTSVSAWENEKTIDMRQYPPGVYILSLLNTSNLKKVKIIKE